MADSALDILQQHLDLQCSAFEAGDVRKLGQTMALPYQRKFSNKSVLIETTQDMLEEMTVYTQSLKQLGMNSYIRLATSADFLGTDYIAGLFVTHAFRNAVPLFDSFESSCVLARQPDGGWAMTEHESAIHIYSWPVDVSRRVFKAGALPSIPEDDPRRTSMSAFDIYQTFLDRTAETVATDDFEAYVDLMHFPYDVHGSALDQIIESPEDLRPFYEVLRRCHDGTVGDRIVRQTERAEFISSDQICGYHNGTVYAGNTVTVDPVQSSMILRREGTRWRLQSVNNSIDNREYPFSMYQPGGRLPTHLEIQKRTKQ